MIAYGMLYAAAVGLLTLLTAFACSAVLRKYGRPERGIWLAALGLALTLPVVFLMNTSGGSSPGASGTPPRSRVRRRSIRDTPRNRCSGVTRRGCRLRRTIRTRSRRSPHACLVIGFYDPDAQMDGRDSPNGQVGSILACWDLRWHSRLADHGPRASRLRDLQDSHPGAVMVGVAA